MDAERPPPQRIRVTGLQEAQLEALVELERACTEMYYDIGFDGAEVPARGLSDIVGLTRDHEVKVAEADHVVAGYMAFRDESPGVAYLEEISVHPEYQRFGVGARLLEALWEGARESHLGHVVCRAWEKAAWAMAFYEKAGFKRLGDDAPSKVLRWRDERAESGRPLTRPGEVVLWAAVPPKAEEEDDDDDGEPPGSQDVTVS
jgi:amino-acid N-acetyltransferase